MCIQELDKVRLAMYLLAYTHTVAILNLVFTLDICALLEGLQRVLSHTETSGGESPGWFVYSTLSSVGVLYGQMKYYAPLTAI